MDKKIHNIVKSIADLQKKAVESTLEFHAPRVEKIIATKCKNVQEIEQTLDALLEVAFDVNVLTIFKRLCRYYYDIDEQATAEYVQMYRDMWDSEKNDDK